MTWYDVHAESVARQYESLDFRTVHPVLAEFLAAATPLSVLDVGAGSGRDAAAIARLGHPVTAVESSKAMLRIAQRLHALPGLEWVSDDLPKLERLERRTFDLVVLSAVWMHLPPHQHRQSFERLVSLIEPQGLIYLTLRLGPADPDRGFFPVVVDDVIALAKASGLEVADHGLAADLLGRSDVAWRTLVLTRRGANHPSFAGRAIVGSSRSKPSATR